MFPYRYAKLRQVWHLIERPDAIKAVCGAYVGEAPHRAVEAPASHVCGNCLRVLEIRSHRST